MDIEHYRERLKNRLVELEKRLHGIEDQLDAPGDDDSEERATEREGDEVLEGLGHAGLLEAEAIRLAFKRMDKGTFGTCASCENEISKERLDLLPHTALCRNCASAGSA